MHLIRLINIVLTSVISFIGFKYCDAISCFVCESFNNDNPDCEDPFLRSNNIKLVEDCSTGIPNKSGTYRASHCIKLTAYGHGLTYVIRTCSLDHLTGREDQEIVQISHCGYMGLKNFYGFDLTQKENLKYNNMSNIFEKQNLTIGTSTKIENSSSSESSTSNSNKNYGLFRGCLSICHFNECNGTFSSMNTINYLFNFFTFIALISVKFC